MSFRFKKAASVIVGTFNIYIVQPNWLAQVGILPEAVLYNMKADLDRPGFQFQVKESAHTWNVRPDRITLESETWDADCGTPLADVIEALKWTPLMGVGTNLEFEAELDELTRMKFKCPEIQPPKDFNLRQTTWHAALSSERHTFNFQVSVSRPSDEPQRVLLAINVHTEIGRQLKQVEANPIGQDACRKFLTHRDQAVQLAEDVFEMEITR